MISKEDAKTITDAKKSAYVKEKALEYIPICFNNVRKAANKMEYKTRVHIEGKQFIPEIVGELAKVIKELGYLTTTIGGRANSKYLYIYWRELNDEEKKRQI
jgi:hypothetical protein